MQIAKNKVVTIDYVLTDEKGNLLDEAKDGTFAYLHGSHNIIPGLEEALEGKRAGESAVVSVSPTKGYGVRNDALIQAVDRSQFQEDTALVVGMQFHAQSNEGHDSVATITQIDGDKITIDSNHPLAGVNLHFKVDIINVRDANHEEASHGHVHGPEGHHHH